MLIKALKEFVTSYTFWGSKNLKGNVIKKDKYRVWHLLGNRKQKKILLKIILMSINML